MVRKAVDYNEVVQTQNYKTSYHLKGRVIDSNTDTPMGLASIAVANSSIGTYTDEEGNFDIEIPAKHGQSSIIIQYLGYDNQQYKISESENEYLLIPLNVSACSISEIMIVNRESEIRISGKDNAMIINNTQVQNTTSGLAGNDLSRNLQLLPGINAADDASAEIKIRGSNDDETLLILDGIPVYNANHYYGIFSSINSNYIEKINFYKNAFPIQYGGKTAGVVEILSKDKLNGKSKLTADINLLTASVNLGLPISKTSSLFVSGRSTLGNVSNTKFNSFSPKSEDLLLTQNFVLNTAKSQVDPNFNFYDLNAKYAWVPNEETKLSFNFYSSMDDFSIDSNFGSERRLRQKINLRTNIEEQWSNLGASALLNTKLSESLKIDARLFYSQYANEGFTDLNIKNELSRVKDLSINTSQVNNLSDIGANIKVSKLFQKNTLSIGIESVRHDVEYQFQENKKINLSGNSQVNEITPYASYNVELSNKVNFNLGARSSYYDGTEKLYFSPRLSFNYIFSDAVRFKGSYSKNQQFLRELNYEYRGQLYELWVQGNQKEIPIIESQNLMIGGTARFGNFLLDIEAYRKDMTGMLEYAVVNPTGLSGGQAPGQSDQENNQNSPYELFTGKGRSMGVDILLSANFKQYDTYLSYTLSKTEHSFDQIRRGEYFASEDDRTHQLKWINEYHLSDFTFGANWIFSTGRLYTDLNAFTNNEDIRDIPVAQRFKRLPAYQRLDLSAGYGLDLGEHKASLSLSVINALDNMNVKYEQLIESRDQDDQKPLNAVVGTTTNLLNRTLNLSFRIDLN